VIDENCTNASVLESGREKGSDGCTDECTRADYQKMLATELKQRKQRKAADNVGLNKPKKAKQAKTSNTPAVETQLAQLRQEEKAQRNALCLAHLQIQQLNEQQLKAHLQIQQLNAQLQQERDWKENVAQCELFLESTLPGGMSEIAAYQEALAFLIN